MARIINTYRIVTDENGNHYVEAVVSGALRFCGEGHAGMLIAKNLCEKWNAAAKRYLRDAI